MEHFFYDQSASNTRSVGGEIALVSNNIISKGKSSRALMYCVGHSLGAHVCGHAGTQGQFGRITGRLIYSFKLFLKRSTGSVKLCLIVVYLDLNRIRDNWI